MGMIDLSRNYIIIIIIISVIILNAGECITTGFPGDVCSLNSVATECSNLTASSCECKIGFDQQDDLTCIGRF